MADVLVLRNQHGDYLSKQREWISAGDSKTLFRSTERDEIINEKVELTVKSPDLRVSVLTVKQEDNGRLSLDGENLLKKLEAVAPDSDEQTLFSEETETETDETEALRTGETTACSE
jgi:hypothetical protein